VSWLEARIPPPLVGLLCGTFMWFADTLVAPVALAPAVRYGLAVLLAAVGLAVAAAGVRTVTRASTTLNPLKPGDATALVTGGVYQWTRNPMYLGMLLLLAGWGVFLGNPLGLAGLALFVAWITRFQILPEERALGTLFGQAFEDYRQRVRRWV
jgi:protein-S-isoprenylcysteine O-methyltransferase Ste14